ncbi:DUF421 domain-containing protein [Clostridium algidicarnis]|uniref:Uncharacterized membrane protein YcaP (DUF421 family) n=2 Tax=Clostridium algidicarnis TaxID=37659 RepID=A0A2S6FVZ9_9CLOT|nr:DUF421 domain-containing protein [Clostridium algidicarnis]MBB6632050.1 DUF421 domain-containing protein [Clostridium algidicarnis]MBB6698425.1 DUF421 domain-containing protein [Clostridium algidicarnis]MBU3193710.1 DUF421 domain-containing protein [Clostridium algidicarnis]MBU3207274.1 DUF421 domain-containing protein [Clostridium algidicarnis]MBU3220505.1 DUF421 domain-containing protein [Clostridium algidicarnis]
MSIELMILLRTIILLFVTLILTRILGTGSMSNTTPFNFISYVVIAIIVSLMSLNIITNFFLGMIILLTWSLFSIALDYACMKSKWVHDMVNGKERILIKDGKVMEESLSKVRFTGEELLKELRSKGAFNLADVEFAIMETTGDINVGLKSDKSPITPYDLGIKIPPKSQTQTVILDGNVLDRGLTNMGLNQGWLKTKLEGMGVTLENVFIGQVDSSGDLYLDLFDDSIESPKSNAKELLYADLEKSEADFMSFALETEDKEAKDMYIKNAEKLKQIIKKLKPYLLR